MVIKVEKMTLLVDKFHRKFNYLRLSITELCNFRCQYCLPNGYVSSSRPNFLSQDEIRRAVQVFSSLGIQKIRLTGGEPTLRRDFIAILQLLNEMPLITNIAVTTNGYRLYQQVSAWKTAGLTSLNVSLDSLNSTKFKLITGEDKFDLVWKGIERALDIGILRVKVNVVLLKNMNDQLSEYLSWIKTRPIELRFIELMETGLQRDYFQQYHVSGHSIESALRQQGWQLEPKMPNSGPARVYTHSDYVGKIGLIMPYSSDFCLSCNRLRLSSSGKFHLCLFGEKGTHLRDLLADDAQETALKQRILTALTYKRESHYLHAHDVGITQNLSFIGG